MSQRSTKALVIGGALVSLGLPLLGSLLAMYLFSGLNQENLPVHTLIETAGGVMAIAIAGILTPGSRLPH